MKRMKVLAVIAAAAAMMSIGFTASAEEKVLNFGCAMYTDGMVTVYWMRTAAGMP